MEIVKIRVGKVAARVISCAGLPAGIVGAVTAFEFTDPIWEGLTKTAVFKGCVTKDVVIDGNAAEIPAEVVSSKGYQLKIGIYGVDSENNIAIPTLWASVGQIQDATDPSGDLETDPSLPIWAQLADRVAALEQSGTGSGSIVVDEDGYLTTSGGGFTIDEDGYILL